jgi:hypothetical protein
MIRAGYRDRHEQAAIRVVGRAARTTAGLSSDREGGSRRGDKRGIAFGTATFAAFMRCRRK